MASSRIQALQQQQAEAMAAQDVANGSSLWAQFAGPSRATRLERARTGEAEAYATDQVRQAQERSAAGERQAQGFSDVMTAAGMQPQGIPGIGGALAGPQGAEVANQLMGNPNVSPQAALQQAQAQQDRQQQQVAAGVAGEQAQANLQRKRQQIQLANQDRLNTMDDRTRGFAEPLMDRARGIGTYRDMSTILKNVGTETLPGPVKGRYAALRFQGLNRIRETTEAGALQQAEIELFNEILPSGDDFFNLSNSERIARLSELERWEQAKFDDGLTLSGGQFSAEDFPTYERSWDELRLGGGELPGDTSGLPDAPPVDSQSTPAEWPDMRGAF
jgi:hypothetical protein